jgi:hypothetical protein
MIASSGCSKKGSGRPALPAQNDRRDYLVGVMVNYPVARRMRHGAGVGHIRLVTGLVGEQ